MGYSSSITNFNSGLWSSYLSGRISDEGYRSALLQCENFFIQSPSGAAKKRSGTYYISTCYVPDHAVKLISFDSSDTGRYVVEVGNYYMRVFDTDGNITCSYIASPYSSDEIDKIKYIQKDESIYIAHKSYPVKKLTLTSGTTWTIADVPLTWGPFLDQNEDEESTITISGSKEVGSTVVLTASEDIFNEGHVGAYWKFNGYTSVSGNLSSTGSTTSSIKVNCGEEIQVNLFGTWSGTAVVQRSEDEINWATYTEYNETTQSIVTEPYADNIYYRINYIDRDSGTIKASLVNTDVTGYVQITAYSSPTTVTATVIEKLPEQLSLYKWSEGAFSEYRGYPGSITIAQQRLFLAGTIKNPNTIFVTKTGKYENFDIGVVNADDGMVLKIASRRSDEVLSMLTYDDSVHIFTDGVCYRLSGSDSGIITPTTPMIQNDVFVASENIQSQGIGNFILFVEKYGKTLNHKYYDSDAESYVTKDINSQSDELFEESNIIDIDFARYPNKLLYATKDDGEIAVCTYDAQRGMSAWSKYTTTNGLFESTITIPGENEHETWFIVNRNGARCIEKMSSSVWTNLEDSNYLDSAVTYSGSNYYFQGLNHLEGCTAGVTVSGMYLGDYIVTEGQVVLPNTYWGVTVGLKYDAILQTMPIDMPGNMGNSQGRNKKISDVSVKVKNTLGISVGTSDDVLDVIPQLESGVSIYGESPALYSGPVRVTLPGQVDREISIICKSTSPTPVHILAIIPEITTY